jgi:hypothetical protein
MVRTSLLLPASLYQRLFSVSKERGQSLSATLRYLLEPILHSEEEVKRRQVYEAFHKVQGISNASITDASTTIDQVLYGQQEAHEH